MRYCYAGCKQNAGIKFMIIGIILNFYSSDAVGSSSARISSSALAATVGLSSQHQRQKAKG